MNDQNQMMNQAQMLSMSHQQMGNQAPLPHIMNQSQPQVINQPQYLNQNQLMNHSQALQQQSQMIMNQPQPPMMSSNYTVWSRAPQPPLDPNNKYRNFPKSNYGNLKQPRSGRGNWKGKNRRTDNKPLPPSVSGPNPNISGGGYQPPSLHELQSQNRIKARKFYSKKKFGNRFAPYAPRNTTSYIIRAKKSGGIASLVSPCPVTPAVLPTPMFSPSREALGDMAKEEWGVDGYGSMKGLIRLRGSENKVEAHEEEEEDCGGGSSDSDVEEHLEVERRLDHDLSRFEMIYQNYGVEYNSFLENRVDDQDSHIAQLEEENLTLKERLFLMERELGDLRRKLQLLERRNPAIEDVNEEVVENVSENESDGGSEMDYVSESRGIQNVDVDPKEEEDEVLDIESGDKFTSENFMQKEVIVEKSIVKDEEGVNESDKLLAEENIAKDEEMKNEFISGDVNECEDTDENSGDVLASDAGIGKDSKVNNEEEQNNVVHVDIIPNEKEAGCEESREEYASGDGCS